MKLLTKIKNSIYGPEYYQELVKQPFSYSLKYLFLFTLIFSLLLVIKFSIFSLPKLYSALNSIGPTIIASYPQDLEVSVKGGNVSTNANEPYFFKVPSSWEQNNKQGTYPKNLVTIDTKADPSVENLKKYETFALITKNYFIYQDNEGKITTESLEKMPDTMINKSTVAQFSNKYSPYLNLLIPVVIVIIFIYSFFIVIFRSIYLLLAALFIWLIASIKKADIGYGKSYQLGMHLMTLPLLLISLTSINFPLSFTTLLLVLAAINIQKNEPIPTIVQPVSSPNNQSDNSSSDV
jgi:hypothetical protein